MIKNEWSNFCSLPFPINEPFVLAIKDYLYIILGKLYSFGKKMKLKEHLAPYSVLRINTRSENPKWEEIQILKTNINTREFSFNLYQYPLIEYVKDANNFSVWLIGNVSSKQSTIIEFKFDDGYSILIEHKLKNAALSIFK